jgi:hypothetical protein
MTAARVPRHMRRTLACATGLTLWSVVVIGGQTVPTGAQLTHLKAERFEIVTSIRGLPLGVRHELQTLWGGGTLDIAEPGAEFQAGGTNPALPSRRLAAAGCARDLHCLVYYERAGQRRTWVALLFRWTPDETRLEWGGTAPAGLRSIDEVRTAALSGALKQSAGW